MAKKAKLSDREKKAAAAGMSTKEYSAAKKGGSSKKTINFNASIYGKNFEKAFNSADPATQASAQVLLSQLSKNAIDNQPAPAVLDDKELKKLWTQAENDETISKEYAEDLKIGKDQFLKNLDLFSKDYAQLTDKQKQNYVDTKKAIEKSQAEAGTLFSGVRKQTQKKFEKEQADIIESTKRTAQAQLGQLQGAFEQKFGTKTLAELGVGTVKAGTTAPVGAEAGMTLPSTSDVSYTPLGDIAGTQATARLGDVESQYQELQSEALQKETQTNYQDWLKKLKKQGQIK